MSKVSAKRAKDAEALIAEAEERGAANGRRAGFSYVTLTRDGYCRTDVTFMGMGNSVSTKGADAREALTKAYVFHKMKVDGFNDAGTY